MNQTNSDLSNVRKWQQRRKIASRQRRYSSCRRGIVLLVSFFFFYLSMVPIRQQSSSVGFFTSKLSNFAKSRQLELYTVQLVNNKISASKKIKNGFFQAFVTLAILF